MKTPGSCSDDTQCGSRSQIRKPAKWLLMAFTAGKAVESHKAESRESQSRWKEPEQKPESHQSPHKFPDALLADVTLLKVSWLVLSFGDRLKLRNQFRIFLTSKRSVAPSGTNSGLFDLNRCWSRDRTGHSHTGGGSGYSLVGEILNLW